MVSWWKYRAKFHWTTHTSPCPRSPTHVPAAAGAGTGHHGRNFRRAAGQLNLNRAPACGGRTHRLGGLCNLGGAGRALLRHTWAGGAGRASTGRGGSPQRGRKAVRRVADAGAPPWLKICESITLSPRAPLACRSPMRRYVVAGGPLAASSGVHDRQVMPPVSLSDFQIESIMYTIHNDSTMPAEIQETNLGPPSSPPTTSRFT